MEMFDVYKDIELRTKGEFYLGIVGPVRTGKSTFIKRFMDLLVLPKIQDIHTMEQTRDELPQSASGKTIMTTEPKFVPKEAVEIPIAENVGVNVRLIDCVGYMVEGATGHTEKGEERQVKTPWYEEEIPFTQAATIGTQKVIRDHATIGIIVTTDGSIGDLKRESYLSAEEKTIRELQAIGKPFIVLVNSRRPYSEEAKKVANQIENQYGVTALPVNCEQLREEDIHHIMEKILFAFPISEVGFYLPKWVDMLPKEHKIKMDIITNVKKILEHISEVKDVICGLPKADSEFIEDVCVEDVALDTGTVSVSIRVKDCYYYEMLSEVAGVPIEDEYCLLKTIKDFSEIRKEYEIVKDAVQSVKMKGYGVVNPLRDEIRLEEPEIIKQGNKYGVKIHAEAPSIHMIRANIETEIAPIVGNEDQAKDLTAYIRDAKQSEDGIWGTSIFGKSVEELVMDGIRNKITMINDESQVKLQDTMQKIVNDSNGGMVCIII